MLNKEDIEAIEACVIRPNSVWEAIKSIITADKYTWYLESLAEVKLMPKIAERRQKWNFMNKDEKTEYMKAEDYDNDLKKVLQQVANVLGGFNTTDDDFRVGTKIPIWKKAETMQRQTAFKAAIAFRFTIEETRKLLFTVLDDDEQMDFNPRLPNEMICAYAIINEIPMKEVQNKDNKESPKTSVEALLYEAKLQFLKILFGEENAGYFPRLIEIVDNLFDILDSVNMTKTALLLAAIKTSANIETLLKKTADEKEKSTPQLEEESIQNERCPKIFPDNSVMQQCYEYVSYDQEDKYYVEIVSKPVFEKAQISRDSCLSVLKYVFFILKTAPNLVNQDSKESDRRIAIYSDMKDFIEKCIKSVQNQSDKSMFSVVDFLEILGESNLGKYTQSEFTAMIDNIIIDNLEADWINPRDISENGRASSYHGDIPKVNSDQAMYFRFFFDVLKVAFRDLRTVTTRECPELWLSYVEMNRILAYPYFSDTGVGMKLWEYAEVIANRSKSNYYGKFEYTYTVEKLEYNLQDAEDMPDPSEFITRLLNDVRCFEFFNHTMISRGKEKFVCDLDDGGKLISRNRNPQTGCIPLFILQIDETLTQDDLLREFYPYSRFQKQYYVKAITYNRSDILKLAFWNFLSQKRNKKYNPELGPNDFTDYFDEEVAPDTCCAEINESNSLDRFLLLCLAHEDPIQFLKEAIAYQKTLPKKESKNFWDMLK